MNIRLFAFLGATILCLFAACSSGENTTSDKKSYQKTPSGLEYIKYTNQEGERAKVGDFLTMHMQYATVNDSVIFSSYDKQNPLSFKFQKTLFKGVLNDGLSMLAAGDSATFLVVADSLYGERLPTFMKNGDKIKYTISINKIQSEQEYQNERKKMRQERETADRTKVEAYLKEKSINAENTSSGLYYVIEKEGKGELSERENTKLMVNYTCTLTDGTVVETTDGEAKEIQLNRQIKGFREGLALLKVGGEGQLIVPSLLGYGDRQRGDIPPNSVLVYDVSIEGLAK